MPFTGLKLTLLATQRVHNICHDMMFTHIHVASTINIIKVPTPSSSPHQPSAESVKISVKESLLVEQNVFIERFSVCLLTYTLPDRTRLAR